MAEIRHLSFLWKILISIGRLCTLFCLICRVMAENSWTSGRIMMKVAATKAQPRLSVVQIPNPVTSMTSRVNIEPGQIPTNSREKKSPAM